MTDYSKEKDIVEKADEAKWRILHRHCTYDCERKHVCEGCPVGKHLEDLHTDMSNG